MNTSYNKIRVPSNKLLVKNEAIIINKICFNFNYLYNRDVAVIAPI